MGKSTWKLTVAGALALLCASAFAGQITLYQHPGLWGQNMTTTMALPNLKRSTFNDFASSVVVDDGTWEACTEPYFHGRCAQLAPGTYRQLVRDLDGLVASVRPVGHEPAAVWVVISPDASPAVVSAAPSSVVINPGAAQVVINSAPAPVVVSPQPSPVVVAPRVVSGEPITIDSHIVLYRHSGRIVRAVELTSNVDNLDTRQFNNGADAALVTGGVWRLCDGVGGRGQCSDFSPGQYASLGALDGRVRSAYLIASVPGYAATVVVPAGRAVLYELPDFGGAEAVVERGPAPDLAWAHFRNPASSLRIESGSWLVCSDLGFQGDCRVLDPGDYPVLAGTLGHGIASARQLWRPEYGALEGVVAPDRHHPDLFRYVP